MNISEKRFREGTGVKFLANGNIRCQGMSARRITRWRKEHNDYTTPNDDLWPECQCANPAITGFFVCRSHGANNANQRRKQRTVLDLVPVDLRELYEIVSTDANYMNRQHDIVLLQSRKAQLLDRLRQEIGTDEAWKKVQRAEIALMNDNTDEAKELLESALNGSMSDKHVWQEIYQIDRGLERLTSTQMKTAKELKLMATAEQMSQLVAAIYELIISGAEKYITDDIAYNKFMMMISAGIQRLANLQETHALPTGDVINGDYSR